MAKSLLEMEKARHDKAKKIAAKIAKKTIQGAAKENGNAARAQERVWHP